MRATQQPGKTETLLDAFHDAIAREGAPRPGRLYHAAVGVQLPQFNTVALRPEACVTILKGASVGKSEGTMRPLGPLIMR